MIFFLGTPWGRYFNVLWEKEIYDEISTLTKDIYSCPVNIKAHFQKNTVYNNYEKNIEFAMIPKFSEVKNKVDWNYVIISFNIERTLDKFDLSSEGEKIFRIFNIIKDNGYKFGRIDFNLTILVNATIKLYHIPVKK